MYFLLILSRSNVSVVTRWLSTLHVGLANRNACQQMNFADLGGMHIGVRKDAVLVSPSLAVTSCHMVQRWQQTSCCSTRYALNKQTFFNWNAARYLITTFFIVDGARISTNINFFMLFAFIINGFLFYRQWIWLETFLIRNFRTLFARRSIFLFDRISDYHNAPSLIKMGDLMKTEVCRYYRRLSSNQLSHDAATRSSHQCFISLTCSIDGLL